MTDKPGLAIAHDQLYVIQPNGAIFGYVALFNAWVKLDGNPESAVIAAGNDHLYQVHNPDNSIWTFSAPAAPQWASIDGNTDTKSIVADGEHVYQIHHDGQIYAYDAGGKTWNNVERNTAAVKIAADADALYQLHKEGAIYKYNGPSAGGWTRLDGNPDTKDIVAGGGDLYQTHKQGGIWKYVDGGWQMLDDLNPNTLQIAAGKAGLYQRQKERIYKYDGSQWNVVMDAEMSDMVVGDVALYVRNDAGIVLRYKDGEWFGLAPVPNA